uniref:Uncharacterized protein n=1 Tax=Anguilla anguilla TaxID=7936 RepID=A0A0E9UHR0_ANGAN
MFLHVDIPERQKTMAGQVSKLELYQKKQLSSMTQLVPSLLQQSVNFTE